MVLAGVTGAAIARELGYTSAHVNQVVAGLRRHPRTEEAIAEKLGLPVEEVFPSMVEAVA